MQMADGLGHIFCPLNSEILASQKPTSSFTCLVRLSFCHHEVLLLSTANKLRVISLDTIDIEIIDPIILAICFAPANSAFSCSNNLLFSQFILSFGTENSPLGRLIRNPSHSILWVGSHWLFFMLMTNQHSKSLFP